MCHVWCVIFDVSCLMCHTWCVILNVSCLICHACCVILNVSNLMCHVWCVMLDELLLLPLFLQKLNFFLSYYCISMDVFVLVSNIIPDMSICKFLSWVFKWGNILKTNKHITDNSKTHISLNNIFIINSH